MSSNNKKVTINEIEKMHHDDSLPELNFRLYKIDLAQKIFCFNFSRDSLSSWSKAKTYLKGRRVCHYECAPLEQKEYKHFIDAGFRVIASMPLYSMGFNELKEFYGDFEKYKSDCGIDEFYFYAWKDKTIGIITKEVLANEIHSRAENKRKNNIKRKDIRELASSGKIPKNRKIEIDSFGDFWNGGVNSLENFCRALNENKILLHKDFNKIGLYYRSKLEEHQKQKVLYCLENIGPSSIIKSKDLFSSEVLRSVESELNKNSLLGDD